MLSELLDTRLVVGLCIVCVRGLCDAAVAVAVLLWLYVVLLFVTVLLWTVMAVIYCYGYAAVVVLLWL